MPGQVTLLNNQLLSEEMNQFISHRPHWVLRWANTVFLSLFIIVAGLAWSIRYPETIKVPVHFKVLPSGHLYGELDPGPEEMKKIVEGQPVVVHLNSHDHATGRLTGKIVPVPGNGAAFQVDLANKENWMPGVPPAASAEIVISNKRLITKLLGQLSKLIP